MRRTGRLNSGTCVCNLFPVVGHTISILEQRVSTSCAFQVSTANALEVSLHCRKFLFWFGACLLDYFVEVVHLLANADFFSQNFLESLSPNLKFRANC